MDSQTKVAKGSCLCRSIEYELHGELRPVVLCHCAQCRKATGHYGAATQVKASHVHVRGATLKWYQSSKTAERGFCTNCGGNLFWRQRGSERISIWAGTLDGKTGLKIKGQLYPESAGDYYDVPDVPVMTQASGE